MWKADGGGAVDLATFAFRPRESLMWPPRRADVRRIASWGRRVVDSAAAFGSGLSTNLGAPRFVDYGAGTGLLAQLLRGEGVAVDAFEPDARVRRFGSFVDSVSPPYDVAVVSWMEAGQDYREDVARLAPIIVNVYDVEGGCGVKGEVEFRGWSLLDSWRTASFEDAAFALQRKGRGLKRKGYPGNQIDVLSRSTSPSSRAASPSGDAGSPYPWEKEMAEAGL